MDKNQHALALAFRRAKAKNSKIKELGITKDISHEAIDDLIAECAKAKAAMEGNSWTDNVKGMRWYVESLVDFSKLTPQEKLDREYDYTFAEVASETEMLKALAD